jgi:CSLREA domain-containing protein
LLLLVAALVLLAFVPAGARAATITVDTAADDITNNSNCTLREAMQAANTNATVDNCQAGDPTTDTIELPGSISTYDLTIPGAAEDANQTGDLDHLTAGGPVVIDGQGSNGDTKILASSLADRLIDNVGGSLTLQHLVVQGGNVTGGSGIEGRGGGVRTGGSAALTLDDVVLTQNVAVTGGALYASGSGTVTITGSGFTSVGGSNSALLGGALSTAGSVATTIDGTVFDNNTASQGLTSGTAVAVGGAIDNEASTGSLMITNTTFRNNSARNSGTTSMGAIGGAIYSTGSVTISGSLFTGNLTTADGSTTKHGGVLYLNALTSGAAITNSTFAGNEADGLGGAIYSSIGTNTVLFSTFDDNNAGAGGDSFYSGAGSLTIGNSAINNDAFGDPCAGADTASAGYNVTPLPDPQADCAYVVTDNTSASLAFETVFPANNGGPTKTLALLPTSDAVDEVPNAFCAGAAGVDQRGLPRPSGSACDAGAFELQQPPVTPPSGGGGGGGAGPAPDTTKPVISSLKAKKKKGKLKTFDFTSSEGGSATFAFTKKKGKKYKSAGSQTKPVVAGKNSIKPKKLKKGKYKLKLTIKDAAGNVSASKSLSFSTK